MGAMAGGTVTIVFTDLVGSTELLARGDEAADELRRSHFGVLREAVQRHGGREVKSLGDGLMLVFDSALSALACAKQIQRVTERQNATRPDARLAVRVGMNVGEPLSEQGDYFGTPVVVASRLCARAAGGQVLVSELLRALVAGRGGHEFRELGAFELKGLSEPVAASELLWRAPQPRTRVRLCGPLELELDGRSVADAVRGGQASSVLCYLLAHRERAVGRSELIEMLWPERAPKDPQTDLRPILSGLRRALGPELLEGKDQLRLALPAPVWVDTEVAASALESARAAARGGDWHGAREHAEAVLDVLAPGFLPGHEAEWIEVRRRELEDVALEALEWAARGALALGGTELGAALRAARELISRSPYRETGYRYLMEAFAQSGNVAEALRVYEQLRCLLRDELGAVPAPELQALHERLLTSDAPSRPPEPDTTGTAEKVPEGGAASAETVVPARRREVRKTVTVLFADVTGSTALDTLDPESLRHVMVRYFDVARTCLERHGGTVETFFGDAVMGVFGVPTVHEDDALRALRAAAELRDSLTSLNDELERDYRVSLQLCIGVNTGGVVTGTEEGLTGDAVNVAARLEQVAEPGEILIGAQTCELARGAIEVEPVAGLSLKGRAHVVAAYRLLRVVEGEPAFHRRLDAPLVGRREELARLRAAFDAAISGRRCRLVTVLGPPGIGKSRLARELARAVADEATVLSGRCLPYGEGITYWPLVEMFREAGAEEALGAALSAGGPEEIFWAVRKNFGQHARERPVVLVVEDIHWAEPTLLDLLEHLVDWTRDAPLLLLCLARPELLDERSAWGRQSQAETLRLEPLSKAESDELIEGLVAGSRLEEEIRARIRETAEGNPLFVEQLLAVSTQEGAGGDMPPTIHALLAARLDALPDDERELLERAAVIGLEFEWEVLGELDPDRRRPPGGPLAALVRKELIRPHDAIEDGFCFRHGLIRDAAYDRIPKKLCSDLHERFADWLDGRGEQSEEIVGYHLEQAYRCVVQVGPPDERARSLAERAAERLAASGRRAHARADPPAAVNLLERAGALLPSEDRRRLDLLPSLGRSLFDGGQLERAEAVLSEAVDRGRAAGERGIAADAAVALCHLRLFTAPQKTIQQDVARELRDAIRIFEELGEKAGLARALSLAGALRYWQGQAAAGIRDLERAARHARHVGDRAQEAESLRYIALATLFGPTPVGEALERIDELRSRAPANWGLEVGLLRVRAQLEAMQDRFDAARQLIAQASALVDEIGLGLQAAAAVAHHTGYIDLLAGAADAAERTLRPACEALERIGDKGRLATLAPRLADALYVQGRDDEALRLTELAERIEISGDADPAIAWRRVRAKLLARRGDLEEGERLAREAAALAADTDLLDDRARANADLAEVLRLAGPPEESAAALHEAIRLYEQKGNIAAATRLAGAPAVAPR